MRSGIEQQDNVEHESYKELRVLSEVEASSDITQRQLAQRAGIALGLTNAILRNLIKKGYIRSQQASWKRWVYSLTPEGAFHKIRLTVAYVRRFLDHYQDVRHTLREQMEPLSLHVESRVAIFGTGEFAELVYLGLKELSIDEIDVFSIDPPNNHRFLGMPVRDLNALRFREYDRILVAILDPPPNDEIIRILGGEGDPDKLVSFFTNARSGEQV